MSSSHAKMWLAFTTMGSCFVLIYMVIWIHIPIDKKDIVMFVLGFLSGTIGTIINYYFGSTSTSAKKSETIDKLLEKTNET